MARERMVTRTINVTMATAICMDVSTVETSVRTLELTGETYTPDKALQALKKIYETDTFKVVAISDLDTVEKLYGMPEVDFLKVAQELDPETRKRIEQ